MKKLHLIIRKGDAIDSIDLVAQFESKIMDACIQYADGDPQKPENLDFLTAKESFHIIIKNQRRK